MKLSGRNFGMEKSRHVSRGVSVKNRPSDMFEIVSLYEPAKIEHAVAEYALLPQLPKLNTNNFGYSIS